ncbi:MAG: hypothetical protein M3P96_07175 [Actinomycetota bacterium]|nr:hypothetical protein [Actinomycetota bacterium]
MSTLALFWPHPVLASSADPLLAARRSPMRTLDGPEIEQWALRQLEVEASSNGRVHRELDEIDSFFAWPGAIPAGAQDFAVDALGGGVQEDQHEDDDAPVEHVSSRLDAHVDAALSDATRSLTLARAGRPRRLQPR